jgi:hypothetical protein
MADRPEDGWSGRVLGLALGLKSLSRPADRYGVVLTYRGMEAPCGRGLLGGVSDEIRTAQGCAELLVMWVGGMPPGVCWVGLSGWSIGGMTRRGCVCGGVMGLR